jgi:predicted  nucleic acid-binding Zn-ribbon protein
MANKMNRESLERELFTMKMRCHEYELRLQEVNLHGATGASLQTQNLELLERVGHLESDGEAQRAENEGLREICIKTRDAMVELQRRIEELTTESTARQQEIDTLSDKNTSLRKERDTMTTKYTDACALFREQETRLEERAREAEHELQQWKSTSQRLEVENKTQKRVIETDKLQITEHQAELDRLRVVEQKHTALVKEMQETKALLEESMKDRDTQHTKVVELNKLNEQLERDVETSKKEAKLAGERTVALEGERLRIQVDAERRAMEAKLTHVERTLELTREENAAKTLEYERLKLRNDTLSTDAAALTRQLARLRADMDNAQEHERRAVQQTKDAMQAEMDEARRQMDSQLDHQRSELRTRLCDKEDAVVNLQARLRQLKIDCSAKVAAMEHEMERVKEEKHRIQTKWNASITAKKRVAAARSTGTSSTTRPARARSVGPRMRPPSSSTSSRRELTSTTTTPREDYGTTRRLDTSRINTPSERSSQVAEELSAVRHDTQAVTRTPPQRTRSSKQRPGQSTETKKKSSSGKKKTSAMKRKVSARRDVRSPSPLRSSLSPSTSPTRFSTRQTNPPPPPPQPQPSREESEVSKRAMGLAAFRAARRRSRQPFGVHTDSAAELAAKTAQNNRNIQSNENNNRNNGEGNHMLLLSKPTQSERDDIAKKAQMYFPVKSKVLGTSQSPTKTSSKLLSRTSSSSNGSRTGRLRNPAVVGAGRRRALSSSASMRPSAMR